MKKRFVLLICIIITFVILGTFSFWLDYKKGILIGESYVGTIVKIEGDKIINITLDNGLTQLTSNAKHTLVSYGNGIICLKEIEVEQKAYVYGKPLYTLPDGQLYRRGWIIEQEEIECK